MDGTTVACRWGHHSTPFRWQICSNALPPGRKSTRSWLVHTQQHLGIHVSRVVIPNHALLWRTPAEPGLAGAEPAPAGDQAVVYSIGPLHSPDGRIKSRQRLALVEGVDVILLPPWLIDYTWRGSTRPTNAAQEAFAQSKHGRRQRVALRAGPESLHESSGQSRGRLAAKRCGRP